MKLSTEIKALKGIGDKTASLFLKLGIRTLEDLLHNYPISYTAYEEVSSFSQVGETELVALKLRLQGSISVKRVRRLTISTCKMTDGETTLSLTFFNMPYLNNVIKPNIDYVVRGRLLGVQGKWKMEQPSVYKTEAYEKLAGSRQPVYALTKGLTNHAMAKAIRQTLDVCEKDRDYLPDTIKEKYALMEYWKAVEEIHFPSDEASLCQARNRLVFDEFLLFILQIRKSKENKTRLHNPYPMLETAETVRFLEKLPYSLTNAQRKVWEEIKADMLGDTVMNRLVQGDVGSGKTIVALLALLLTASNGCQGALMAPTEVLAGQHYENIAAMTKSYQLPFTPVLLTGSMSAKDKRAVYERIESGEANLIIGTHALIQEKVIYHKLALVITDEQHRFGVRQREALAGKGIDTHVLVMSATPIPRTLAIILYGDLHISIIDEMPKNRLPIKNCVVGTGYRDTAYRFIEGEVEKGRQAYVICPMVEEGVMDGLENVIDYTEKLRSKLSEQVQIAYLHGQMKATEKNRIMESFAKGDIDVLVSTTVIEVGIDVPNATVMMIENAERFGLAQLHQLRGRVGRGKEQSYCIFINTSDKKETSERLSLLNKSNDGFYIAGEDLRLRGPGDLFGIRQSGSLAFRIADIFRDAAQLKAAGEAAELFEKELEGISVPISVDFRSI